MAHINRAFAVVLITIGIFACGPADSDPDNGDCTVEPNIPCDPDNTDACDCGDMQDE